MKKIQVLDSVTVNKIAAGEVIERPASVVKELVENAIDAGSGLISVEIKDGGTTFIKVSDNGTGIEPHEAKTAFSLHATSKITEAADLASVLTLGFRGEALASIASVSKTTMITKAETQSAGIEIKIHGGQFISEKDIGCPTGTTMIVEDLFFNVPARKKFLKKNTAESAHISDIVNKLSLGHPEIAFKYTNNNTVMMQTSGKNDLKAAVLYIYGKETAHLMLDLHEEKEGFVVDGLIGKPETARSNRSYEHLFLNGRYIKCDIVSKAVEDAYKTKIMTGKFPFYILRLTVPSGFADVNVHPAKREVRFSDDDFIYNLFYNAVCNGFKNETMIPTIKLDDKKNKPHQFAPKKFESVSLPFQYSEEIKKKTGDIPAATPIEPLPPVENNTINPSIIPDTLQEEKSIYRTDNKNKKFFDGYNIIGQIFHTYWLVEQNESLYLIDQHAAHERILYEELVHKLKREKNVSQVLLRPIVVSLKSLEKQILLDNLDFFNQCGFALETFGESSYALRAVPYIFNNPESAAFFLEVIDLLKENHFNHVYETQTLKIATMACKAAVKGSSQMDFLEAKSLIEKLLTLENPYCCPHGRPSIVEITKYEIEKMFKRKV